MTPVEQNQQPSEEQQPREPIFNIPGAVLAAIMLCTGIHALRVYGLTTDQDVALLVRGAFIPIRYSGDYILEVYAFTSPLTYSLLHGGWSHLIINMVWLAAFGTPLANRLGIIRFILFWMAATLGAVVLHYALHSGEDIPLVGASGAISGMMGAAARFGFRIDRSLGHGRFAGRPLSIIESLSSRTVLAFLIVWFVVNLIAGLGLLTPGEIGAVAWEAHVGGFLVGFLLIGLFGEVRQGPRHLH